MTMHKGDPLYGVSPRRVLFAEKGTELRISPLLEGIRTLSGEKIQWYLASELRDRIKDAHVRVTVIDNEVDAMIDRVIGNKQLPANVSRRDHAPQSRNRKMFLIACYNSMRIA